MDKKMEKYKNYVYDDLTWDELKNALIFSKERHISLDKNGQGIQYIEFYSKGPYCPSVSVFIHPDGTWTTDSNPDYNGAS